MKILAFGASNSANSINQTFSYFTANLFHHSQVETIDLNDFECPIYSPQRQKEGFPTPIIRFYEKMENADLIVLSFAEYNGSYTSAFKNIFDWLSTYKSITFENFHFLLMSTSPGARGGISVLETALDRFPKHGAKIHGSFSLPYFHDNFCDKEKTLKEPYLSSLLDTIRGVNESMENLNKVFNS
ncbi:MAG: NAD(P)H-dependent oxidoreductase [Bacteroidetes bacterium]|nr:NAD(P)H-dependent oxidoreductase [Bacteroidota bacterium]